MSSRLMKEKAGFGIGYIADLNSLVANGDKISTKDPDVGEYPIKTLLLWKNHKE